MKGISRILLVFLISVGMVAVSSCAGTNKSSSNTESRIKKIGIIQIIEHPSLNTVREETIKRMAEKEFKDGVNIKIDYQNAQGDQSNLKAISQKFVSQKYDLIIAIATPSAQAVAGETSEIPIVFSACTDALSAGLVEDLEKPGKNITGTSDAISAAKNMELAKRITPNMKTIGALYNSGESNSIHVIDELKEYAKKNNMNVVEAAVTSTSDVQQATQSLVDKADVIFAPNDNTIASCVPIVSQVTTKAKVPLYVGADSMVKDGGLAGYGVNYIILGQETGNMVVDILNGKKPGDIPVRVMKKMDIYLNKNIAKDIGVAFPEDVLKEAAQVF